MDAARLTDLAAFAVLAKHRSFRRAAIELGVSSSALSHRLRKLEASLGVRLLNRTTRSVTPTEAGERLLTHLGPALGEIEQGLADLAELRDRPAGRLRLNVPRAAAQFAIAPRLAAFLAAYPGVRVEIVTDNQLTDIVAGGFDAGVRFDDDLPADMIAVRIGPPMRMLIVASPDYLAAHGAPQRPEELADHPCLRLRWPSGVVYRWELERAGDRRQVTVEGPLIADDSTLLKEAALGGAGLAFLLEASVSTELEAGRLTPVLEDWCPSFPGYHLYYPSRRQLSPALRAFIGAMRLRA